MFKKENVFSIRQQLDVLELRQQQLALRAQAAMLYKRVDEMKKIRKEERRISSELTKLMKKLKGLGF